MSTPYPKSTNVEWEWGKGTATGKVVGIFTSKVTKTLQGTEVTRNAEQDAPAYLIEQEDGACVLKSHSEVEKTET